MEADAWRHVSASSRFIVVSHHAKLTGGGVKTATVWCVKTCFSCACERRGHAEGSDLQVHPKLPQTGSGGWTSLERYRGGGGGGQKVRVCVERVARFFFNSVTVLKLPKTGGVKTHTQEGEKLHRPFRPQQSEPPLSRAESAFQAPNSALGKGEGRVWGVLLRFRNGSTCCPEVERIYFNNNGTKCAPTGENFISKGRAGCECVHSR